ncbi:MAG: hypothetical protein OXE85_06995, partial [Roseovarius sp.]|nr:hypothetical protein [Roseovarius sp.]
MIQDEEILQQLDLGEDSRWEFKQIEFHGNMPTSPRRDDLADELVLEFIHLIPFPGASGGP